MTVPLFSQPPAVTVNGNSPSRLLRALVVFTVLMAAPLIGAVAVTGRVEPLYLLALASLPPAAWIVLRHGQGGMGVLAILAAGGLLGIVTLPTGTASRIVLSLVLTLGLLLLWALRLVMAHVSGERIAPSPINRPVAIFIAVQVLSFVWSTLLRDPLVYVPGSFAAVQAAALVVTCTLPLLALYVVNTVESVKVWRWAVWLLVVIGMLHLVSVLLKLPTARLTDNGARGLFPMWTGAFALSLLLFDRTLARWQQMLLAALLALLAWYYIRQNTLWLSGWLPMVLAWILVLFFRSKRLFAAAVLVGCAALVVNYDTVYRQVVVANEEEGSGQRLDLWRMNLQHVQRHPLLGMGPAGYAVYNMSYHPEDARSTHNNFFDILAQSGVLGMGAFLLLTGSFARVGLRNVRRLRGTFGFERAFAAATVAGGVGALAGMMLGDWVLPFAYNQTITGFDNALVTWVFLGGIVSLERLAAEPFLPEASKAEGIDNAA